MIRDVIQHLESYPLLHYRIVKGSILLVLETN